MTRVIAVCGYSDGRETGLHPICEGRLRLAEREAGPNDVVLLTGWARHADATAEAELMARSWAGSSRELHVDNSARSTLGNVAAAVELAEALGATEVVLVTSGWHARRAGAMLRTVLGDPAEPACPGDRRARFACHPPARARLLAGCSARRTQARLDARPEKRSCAWRAWAHTEGSSPRRRRRLARSPLLPRLVLRGRARGEVVELVVRGPTGVADAADEVLDDRADIAAPPLDLGQ